MSDLQILSMINSFPIGSVPKSRIELLSKAEIISFLARFQEQFAAIENADERENMVKVFLGNVLGLGEGESIPSLARAESILKLSAGFVEDFGKVQYIKENNPDFDKTYEIIANGIGLINETPRKAR